MANLIQQSGVFRGRIVSPGIYHAESGAVGVTLRAAVDEAWDADTKAWVDWRQHGIEAAGTFWIVKRDGTANAFAVDALVKCTGWQGDVEATASGLWQPRACQFTVTEEQPNEYHEDTQFRIAFLADYDRVPGAVGNVTPERAKELQTRYGSQFRAMLGNASRNAAPTPPTKPKMPGKAPLVGGPLAPAARATLQKAKVNTDINAELPEAAAENDEIPF